MGKATPPITREAALRIALASRAIPNASLPTLIELRQRRRDEPIALHFAGEPVLASPQHPVTTSSNLAHQHTIIYMQNKNCIGYNQNQFDKNNKINTPYTPSLTDRPKCGTTDESSDIADPPLAFVAASRPAKGGVLGRARAISDAPFGLVARAARHALN